MQKWCCSHFLRINRIQNIVFNGISSFFLSFFIQPHEIKPTLVWYEMGTFAYFNTSWGKTKKNSVHRNGIKLKIQLKPIKSECGEAKKIWSKYNEHPSQNVSLFNNIHIKSSKFKINAMIKMCFFQLASIKYNKNPFSVWNCIKYCDFFLYKYALVCIF